MTPFHYLTHDEVVLVHENQIRLYGGSIGIRDEGLLLSAVAMAESGFGGELMHPTVASAAAAYLYYLTKNHAFIDGNKRVGSASALTFLDRNGWKIVASDEELVELVLAVAAENLSKDRVVEFFERWMRPR